MLIAQRHDDNAHGFNVAVAGTSLAQMMPDNTMIRRIACRFQTEGGALTRGVQTEGGAFTRGFQTEDQTLTRADTHQKISTHTHWSSSNPECTVRFVRRSRLLKFLYFISFISRTLSSQKRTKNPCVFIRSHQSQLHSR